MEPMKKNFYRASAFVGACATACIGAITSASGCSSSDNGATSTPDSSQDGSFDAATDTKVNPADGAPDTSLDAANDTANDTSASADADAAIADDGGDGGASDADAAPANDGGDAGDGEAGPLRITNVAPGTSCVLSATWPLVFEYGQWYATRLTPPSYPFVVAQVDYEILHGMLGGQDCHADYAHRVQIYKSTTLDGGAPPVTPTVLADVAVSAGAAANHVSVVTLPSPVTLAAGEDLFVAVEMVGTVVDGGADGGPAHSICLSICGGQSNAPLTRDWWSNATSPPYGNWRSLPSYGITTPSKVGATSN
jgi:hypothetical protein